MEFEVMYSWKPEDSADFIKAAEKVIADVRASGRARFYGICVCGGKNLTPENNRS